MKKLFILTLVLLMTIMGSASASKSKFKDPNYNFSNVMNLYLAECVYTPKSNHPHDLQEDSNPTGRALNSLRTALAKKNKNLIIPPEEPTRARLDLHLAVHTLATYTYWKEPWVEEIYENKKIVEKSRDGRERSITIPVKKEVIHPRAIGLPCLRRSGVYAERPHTGRTVYNCIDTRTAGFRLRRHAEPHLQRLCQ